MVVEERRNPMVEPEDLYALQRLIKNVKNVWSSRIFCKCLFTRAQHIVEFRSNKVRGYFRSTFPLINLEHY